MLYNLCANILSIPLKVGVQHTKFAVFFGDWKKMLCYEDEDETDIVNNLKWSII